MAWFRCGKQRTVTVPPHIDDDDSTNQPPPTPQPVPIVGRTKPDRIFSHPTVPLNSKNYLGQYYFEVPTYDFVYDSETQRYHIEQVGTHNAITDGSGGGSGSSTYTVTFEPQLGSVFSTVGVHRVKCIYDVTARLNVIGPDYGMSYHVHREATQDIVVINHGIVVEQATRDCPCDIYSDGYCFFRPTEINSITYNSHSVTNRGHTYTNTYNYMHYYPKTGQTVAVNKISCLPWYVHSLGTGVGERYYIDGDSVTSGSFTWTTKQRDDSTPSIYNQYTAFLTGDGVTPIDINEFSTWSSFYWMRRIDQLFYMVGSVANYQTLANWNVYGVALLETFKNVGFTSAMFASCISNWNTIATSAMVEVFRECSGITDTDFLANWNVCRVYNFAGFFLGCANLVDLNGIKDWDITCPCFNMMFSGCTSLVDVSPLLNWGRNYHYTMYYRFKPGWQQSCFVAEDGVVQSDVSYGSQTDGFSHMFYGCTSIQSLNGLQNITAATPTNPGTTEDTHVTVYLGNYGATRAFANCTSLTNISAISGWRAYYLSGPSISYNYLSPYDGQYHSSGGRVAGAEELFTNCRSLTDISPLTNWDTSTWKAIVGMFSGCSSLTNISPVSNWDLSECEFLINTFADCVSLQDVSPLSGWGSTLGNLYGAAGLLSGCLISSLSFLSTWSSTSKLRTLSYFLYNVRYSGTDLTGFNGLNLSHIDDMTYCFTLAKARSASMYSFARSMSLYAYNVDGSDPNLYRYCHCDSYSRLGSAVAWTGSTLYSLHGLENLDVSKLRLGEGLFSENTYLSDISALSTWSTTGLKGMSHMFHGDQWLSDISPIASWSTSNVETMVSLFEDTSVVNITPLSGWDKSKVTIKKTWVPPSYPGDVGYWSYLNLAGSMLNTFHIKGYSATLGKTLLIDSVTTSSAQGTYYHGLDMQGNNYSVEASTVVIEGTRDASSAALWNLSIPSGYDKPLAVFAPTTAEPASIANVLQWKNAPSWN